MEKLRVRAYNVRFGDAILVSVPDRNEDQGTAIRHIFIDFGNVLSGEGGEDAVFRPVIEDVLEILDGNPLDLYVMTHEHMDHVQGLLYADEKVFPNEDLRQKLKVRHAWLTGSSAPDYYETHEQARKKLQQARQVYESMRAYFAALDEPLPGTIQAMMLNNNPRATTDCVDFIRGLAENTCYVHREFDPQGHHPFREARFEIWAPEEDTSEYYGHFQPVTLGAVSVAGTEDKPTLTVPKPPSGVDAGTFYQLVEMRRNGYLDNLLAIDRAANNTSIVFSLEWRGWGLLFAGDAELRSWKTMNRENVLKPVHFLKVSHHGSHNGTPPLEILDKILPEQSPDGRERFAVVSTHADTYHNVPHDETLAELGQRGELRSVQGLADGEFVDFEFEG